MIVIHNYFLFWDVIYPKLWLYHRYDMITQNFMLKNLFVFFIWRTPSHFLAHPAPSVTFRHHNIISSYHTSSSWLGRRRWRRQWQHLTHICWTNFGITRLWVSWLTSGSCPNKVITTCDGGCCDWDDDDDDNNDNTWRTFVEQTSVLLVCGSLDLRACHARIKS